MKPALSASLNTPAMSGLFLPGWATIEKQYAELFQVCREHGLSLQFGNYDTPAHTTASESVLDNLLAAVDQQIHKVDVVVAYSFGGLLMLNYLSRYSTNIKKLIILDPVVQPMKNYLVDGISAFKDYLRVAFAQDFLKLMFFQKCNRRFARVVSTEMSVMLNTESYHFRKNEMPITFIWGTSDITTRIQNFQRIQPYFPQAKLIKVPNGYHSWISNPALLAEYLAPQITV